MSALGTLLLTVAVGAGLAAVLAQALSLAGRTRMDPTVGLAARAHAGSALAALALMLLMFVVSDVRVHYVWDHTHAAYPLAYKVAGLWGGQEGTVLLWGGLVAGFALLARRGGRTLDHAASLFTMALSTTLLAIALAGDAFRATPALDLALAPHGAGLADVLVTPLMVIHPPIQFLAYALIAMPASYALARWLLPDAQGAAWAAPAYRWARVAWLFATIGLGLGALWAYYVLSFGGYWAWDPVETSNLLPWLALTAFLHAGKHHLRFGDHALAAPLYAVLAYLLTVFATFATRSGLWISVHAFTDPTNRFEPDAAARLLGILDVHLPTRAFLALFTASLLVAAALFLRHHAPRLPQGAAAYARAHAVGVFALAGFAAADPRAAYGALFEAARLSGLGTTVGTGALVALLVGTAPALVYLAHDAAPGARLRLDARGLMAAAVALFGIAALVAFLLNLQVVNGQDRSLFDHRAPLVALPLVAVLTVSLALAPLGRTRALLLAGVGLLGGIVAFLLVDEARVVALATPPLAAAIAATVLRLAHAQGKTAPPRVRLAGALLLVASLLGLVMWSNPPSRLGPLPMPSAVPLAVLGLALGTLALLGTVATFRLRGRALAIAGAAAATLLAGYGVGALLGLAALALLLREDGAAFAPARGFLRAEAPRLRETGIYLVHFALVVGLLGYAASTYSQANTLVTAFAAPGTVEVGEYLVHVGDPVGRLGEDGRYDALALPLTLEKGGRLVPAGELRLEWGGQVTAASYEAVLDVQRRLGEDVYLQPMAFHTPQDGWTSAGATTRLASADVDAVTFRVSVLPLMTLVWSCIWLMGLGMTLVLVGARFGPDDASPQRVPVREAPARRLVPTKGAK